MKTLRQYLKESEESKKGRRYKVIHVDSGRVLSTHDEEVEANVARNLLDVDGWYSLADTAILEESGVSDAVPVELDTPEVGELPFLTVTLEDEQPLSVMYIPPDSEGGVTPLLLYVGDALFMTREDLTPEEVEIYLSEFEGLTTTEVVDKLSQDDRYLKSVSLELAGLEKLLSGTEEDSSPLEEGEDPRLFDSDDEDEEGYDREYSDINPERDLFKYYPPHLWIKDLLDGEVKDILDRKKKAGGEGPEHLLYRHKTGDRELYDLLILDDLDEGTSLPGKRLVRRLRDSRLHETYDQLDTNELCLKVKDKDDQAFEVLLDRYSQVLDRFKRKYFFKDVRSDKDDLEQILYLAFYDAVLSWDTNIPYTEDKFTSFVGLCLKRAIAKELDKEDAQHNQSNIDKSDIDGAASGEPDAPTLGDIHSASHSMSAEDAYVDATAVISIKNFLAELPTKERQSIDLYIQGYKIGEIADKLSLSYKSVENAVRRAKEKLRDHLSVTESVGSGLEFSEEELMLLRLAFLELGGV